MNAFTVDVEDWFHICGAGRALAPDRWAALPSRVVETTRRVLDLADRCGVRGTFFVLGWVAVQYPSLVQEIRAAGHHLASHGQTHQRVYELDEAGFARELVSSRAALAEAGAGGIDAFRAPEWSLNDRAPWALATLARHGFRLDSSRAPLRIIGNPAYPQVPYVHATPAGTVVEMPPFIGRWAGQHVPLGGGWGLRISRPSRVLRALERHNRRGAPAVFWVHPWELDPDPPRVALSPGRWAAHYLGLHGFEGRLATILRGARFVPLAEAVPRALRG